MVEAGFEETPGRIDIALAIPLRGRRVLVARRPEDVHLAGAWEFPGGKIEAGEDPRDAARRELLEETGLTAERLDPLVLMVHDYSDRALRFHVFVAPRPEGEVRMDRPRTWEWKDVEALAALEMPEANRRMIRALRWRLTDGSPTP